MHIYYPNQIFKQLENSTSNQHILVGIQLDEDRVLVLYQLALSDGNTDDDITIANLSIPLGLEFIGTLKVENNNKEEWSESDRSSTFLKFTKSRHNASSLKPIHLNADKESKSVTDGNSNKLESKPTTWLTEQLQSTMSMVRVVAQINSNVELDLDNLFFLSKKNNMIVSKNNNNKDQWDKILDSNNTTELQLYIKISNSKQDIADLLAPTLKISSTTTSKDTTIADISTLVYVNKKSSASNLSYLLQSIKNQLSFISSKKCKTYHYQLSTISFPITAVYELDKYGQVNDDQQKNTRMKYHKLLCLPLNRPMIRSTSTKLFDNKSKPVSEKQQWTTHIKDIHKQLDLDSKIEGTVSLVQGDYDYYHYKQDHINDDGWGCAYRSMQTICSWLKYQDITQDTVPTHLEIQKILVDVGDKASSFYKSSQWIGAIEISICLQQLYNVDCKIINVSSGSDVIFKTRELARHFERDGSPIMIGGGVLAYTLLGVDFNSDTGDSRYLILDPHYTGDPENIKQIKDKGWCGWKGPELFRKDAFYNFCLPQLPTDI